MYKGDTIKGYTILKDFTTAGGGLSKWTFAAKADTHYFMKEFLDPTYPVEGAPGSAKTKATKRQRCERFEAHHRSLMKALQGKGGTGGNLVVTRDFFRWHTKYYKVTDKVDIASLSIEEISALPLERRLLLLLTVVHSLRILHQVGIVHGDLKPTNVLTKQTLMREYTTKLIDFDNSYFSGNPPPPDETVGDMGYYAPETALYIQDDTHIPPTPLTTKADIFSLGLIYCQYLTGKLPVFDQETYSAPYAAVQDGQPLVFNGLPPALATLVRTMLHYRPEERPNAEAVFTTLKDRDVLKEPARAKAVAFSSSPPSPEPKPKLRGTLVKKLTSLVHTMLHRHPEERLKDKDETTRTPKPQLKGTLVGKPDSPSPATPEPRTPSRLRGTLVKKRIK